MPLSRYAKQEIVGQYEEGLATAAHAFLLEFRGISVPQVTELRRRIRQTGGEYTVVKNALALRAVEGKPLEELAEHFRGTTAIAYSQEDPVALAKALTDFAKEVPAIEFKAGLVDGQLVPAEECREIANLPSREVLIAKLLFLLQSPITRLARCLAAAPQQLVLVLEAIRKQKEDQG